MRNKVKSSVQLVSTEALVLGELEAWLNRTGSAGECLIALMPSLPNGGKRYCDL
jgi:hypothetical protein